MALAVTRWERRDSADRNAFGVAAYQYCRAVRAQGARSCRFYWTGADSIVIIAEADSGHIFDDPPTAETAKTLFALADLAKSGSVERWLDPREGVAAYQAADRS